MQSTQLDIALSMALGMAQKATLKLIIANKNYSSWSIRPWIVLTAFGIPFEEFKIPLGRADTGQRIAEYSDAGRLPVLVAGDLKISDSLAICEHLAEQYYDKHLWPNDLRARAIARSVCAEMHCSFGGLRDAMPMNIRARHPGKGRTIDAQADIGRITEIWEDCLIHYGHHQFLFGEFSIADAYFAPVVLRFQTYGVVLAPALQAYCERVLAHPAVVLCCEQAFAETEAIARYDEKYCD